jgi:hypothetical protein
MTWHRRRNCSSPSTMSIGWGGRSRGVEGNQREQGGAMGGWESAVDIGCWGTNRARVGEVC